MLGNWPLLECKSYQAVGGSVQNFAGFVRYDFDNLADDNKFEDFHPIWSIISGPFSASILIGLRDHRTAPTY
jgi:hypothetical protein